MSQTTVVLLQSDPNIAQSLVSSLSNSFHRVLLTKSLDELRQTALKQRPSAIIVDLETATLEDVELLKQEFAGVRIVCNHRVADEEMWSRTLTAGADDFCPSNDMRGLLAAVQPETMLRRAAA